MTEVTISGVIHTLNEERYIATAVRSALLLCDEVLVVDMASDDRTVEFAEKAGARVVQVPRMGGVEPVRAEIMAGVTTDWVLVLDADEIIGPELADRLRGIARDDEADAVRMPRITYMVGARIRGAGWSVPRERHLRFHRPSAVVYPPELHIMPWATEDARVVELPDVDELSMVHFNYLGWDHFVQKMNRYTSTHAREAYEAGQVMGRGRMLRSLVREIWDRMVRDRGYRDGYRGLTLSLLMACYQLLTFAKLRQLHEVGDTDDIGRIYLAEADRLLRGGDAD